MKGLRLDILGAEMPPDSRSSVYYPDQPTIALSYVLNLIVVPEKKIGVY